MPQILLTQHFSSVGMQGLKGGDPTRPVSISVDGEYQDRREVVALDEIRSIELDDSGTSETNLEAFNFLWIEPLDGDIWVYLRDVSRTDTVATLVRSGTALILTNDDSLDQSVNPVQPGVMELVQLENDGGADVDSGTTDITVRVVVVK